MEIKAESKGVKISPRKLRLVADLVRKMELKDAINTLSLVEKRAALPLLKTIKSALSNALNNAKLKEESLILKTVEIKEGPALKRYRPSTRGRVHPYKKRSSHIKVVLEGKE